MKRAIEIAILALCTGCGAILGFQDGSLALGKDGQPCQAGVTDQECASGLSCDEGTCRSPSSICARSDAGCLEGGNGDPTSGTVASFTGEPGGILAMNGYVYFAHDEVISGCAGQIPCPQPQIMYSNPIDPRPRILVNDGSLVAWADPVAGRLSRCFFGMLMRCDTALSWDQPGIRAVTADSTTGDLFVVNGGTGPTGSASDLRVISDRGGGSITTVATLPTANATSAIVSDGPQRKLVQIGRVAYSVFTPSGIDAGASIVNTLVDEGLAVSPPSTAAIMVVARRVVWTRTADQGGGLSQCPILEGAVVCDPDSVRLFAGRNDEITAATSTADTVVWARHAVGVDEIYSCKPPIGDTSEHACLPVLLAKVLRGRVSAIAIEPTPVGPNNPARKVYYVVSDPSTGATFIERGQIP